MIGMAVVDLSVYTGFPGGIQQVSDEREWIAVFLCDPVKTTEVDTKPELAILLLDEEYWCSVGRIGRPNETGLEVLIDELSESGEFCWR